MTLVVLESRPVHAQTKLEDATTTVPSRQRSAGATL
jgi:hypothetical protein